MLVDSKAIEAQLSVLKKEYKAQFNEDLPIDFTAEVVAELIKEKRIAFIRKYVHHFEGAKILALQQQLKDANGDKEKQGQTEQATEGTGVRRGRPRLRQARLC